MSKYTLQVLFDRSDRTYQFNEWVSGRVVLDTHSELNCKKIWIDYGWRTHGRGNRDKGDIKILVLLAETTQFSSGGHREFSFSFKAPNGPVTYHGFLLNVDWYLTVHLDIPFARDVKKEQDFLLLPSQLPEEISLGKISFLKSELPYRSLPVQTSQQSQEESLPGFIPKNTNQNKLFGFTGFFIYIIIGILFIAFFHDQQWYVFGIVVLTFLLFTFGIPLILRAIAINRFEIRDLRVVPTTLYCGNQVSCIFKFRPKISVYLDNIEVKLWADEMAVSGAGTQTTTDTFRIYEKSFNKQYDAKLSPLSTFHLECALPITSDAPASFESANNSIKWFVGIKMKFSRWLTWDKKFPITILPA